MGVYGKGIANPGGRQRMGAVAFRGTDSFEEHASHDVDFLFFNFFGLGRVIPVDRAPFTSFATILVLSPTAARTRAGSRSLTFMGNILYHRSSVSFRLMWFPLPNGFAGANEFTLGIR